MYGTNKLHLRLRSYTLGYTVISSKRPHGNAMGNAMGNASSSKRAGVMPFQEERRSARNQSNGCATDLLHSVSLVADSIRNDHRFQTRVLERYRGSR